MVTSLSHQQPDSRLSIISDRLALWRAQLGVLPPILRNAWRGQLEPRIHPDRDFGNLRGKGPQEVVVVRDAGQAQALLRAANASGRKLRIAARRHSSNGHTLADAGETQLRLDPSGWGDPQMLPGDRLEVPGAMIWREAEAFLQRHGRSAPVLTDHLGTSVGGTLSVGGGIGPRSLVAGRQIDQVERLRLILPTGDAVWVSPTHDPDLFRFTLGGQGILGIIDRVVLRTVPHRPFTTQFKLQFRTLEGAASVAEQLCASGLLGDGLTRLDIVGPMLNTSVVELDLGFEFVSRADAVALRRNPPPAILEHRTRLVKVHVERELPHGNNARSSSYISTLSQPRRRHVFLWNDFMFPTPGRYQEFLRLLEREVFPRLGNRYLMAALGLAYATYPERPESPLAGLQLVAGERPYSIGLNYAVPESDASAIASVRATLDELQRSAVEHGGRLYRYGYSDADAVELEGIYGQDYRDLMQLKARVDPNNVLNPDVLR